MAAPIRTPRERWIEEGLELLASGGPAAVRVDPLAKRLGVSRGGFYWHFADRPALLAEMLDAWERTSVADVIALVEAETGGARARLTRLFALASEGTSLLSVDLAVRDWARHDDAVAARLRRADNARMGHMRELFGAICPDADEVEARCLLAFSLWIGNHFIAADHGSRSRREVLARALERLVA